MANDIQGFEIDVDGLTGSTRSYAKAPRIEAKQDSTKPRIIDVNTAFVLRTAQAMTLGHTKYEQNLPIDDKNYKHADLKFALGRVNNLLLHAMKLRDYYLLVLKAKRNGQDCPAPEEDDLGHLLANGNMLAWWEESGILPCSDPEQHKTQLTRVEAGRDRS